MNCPEAHRRKCPGKVRDVRTVLAGQARSEAPPRGGHPHPRANRCTRLESQGVQDPPHLLLVQGVVLQPVHLQELLSHPNTGQICKDTKVAGHPKACKGARGVSWVAGMGEGPNQNLFLSIDTDSSGSEADWTMNKALCPELTGVKGAV